jgi:hypothetical protein
VAQTAHILTILSTLQLLVSCGRGGEMRSRLAALQAANQADSLLTDDSLALALCDYFDSHGTANEPSSRLSATSKAFPAR